MPYPQNLETAKQLEAIVRENGAIPATIAIMDGVPCIGKSYSSSYSTFSCIHSCPPNFTIFRPNYLLPSHCAIGLTVQGLEKFAKLGRQVRKTARRDIGHVVSRTFM